jgi:regulatory protein
LLTEKKKRRLTPAQAKINIENYCAYQERSHRQVRNKLFTYGLFSSEVESIISDLISSGFLNEERFAKAFAGGKFRMKNWGRTKIEYQLKGEGLSKRCIALGLKEIESGDYEKTLCALLKKKFNALKEDSIFVKRQKAARFAMGKGYESDLIWKIIDREFPD